jgi:hypothetical protein
MRKIIIIYAQGRSGTSILTRLIASSDNCYSSRAEAPILYLISQVIALKKGLNNDQYYLRRHQLLFIEKFVAIIFRIQIYIGSFYEAIKARKINQLPKWLNFKKFNLVTNLPVLPDDRIELTHLKEKFEIEIVGLVRNPLEVLASRIAFPGFKYSISDHIKDILDRDKVFKKNCSKFLTYEQINSKKIGIILKETFNIKNVDIRILNNQIHPTKKQKIEIEDIEKLVPNKELSSQFIEYVNWYKQL